MERESLALTWAYERFSDYLIGLTFHINTDHKHLVPLFSTKSLDDLPIRIQRFHMRMMRFNYTISHVPGKQLVIADMLSWVPTDIPSASDLHFEAATQAFVNMVLQTIPATEQRLAQIRELQSTDRVCAQVKQYCQTQWPNRTVLSKEIIPYYLIRTELSIEDGLLLRGCRIIIPLQLQPEILDNLHTGHLGITKCRARARQSVWWPRLATQLADTVKNCTECCKHQSQRAEPMLSSSLPELPWQKIGTDLFEWKQNHYLLIVDYFSRFIEVSKLTRMTSEDIIVHTKSIICSTWIS